MASRDRAKIRRLVRSFGYAIEGLRYVVAKEVNMRIHVLASFVVILASFWFRISLTEWLIVLLLIAGMFSLELMNTAVEKTVDLITTKRHPLAKHAKDAAAAAVLVYACFAVIIGMLIFWKYIFFS
ncbi:diacylglycerol kinase family protein [Priestia flexa]|uniref:diacylglycerol kinase family protein n=1 Tax=Priestia flexa TaxID=86664 RepID=UPI001B33E05B